MIDPVMRDLNDHLDRLDKDDAEESRIQERADEISSGWDKEAVKDKLLDHFNEYGLESELLEKLASIVRGPTLDRYQAKEYINVYINDALDAVALVEAGERQ